LRTISDPSRRPVKAMIQMNNFAAEPPQLRDAMLSAVSRVLASGWYILGAEVEEFERAWAKACGAKHAVGVGNGMDAIEIALRTLNIGPGDEVITTPMTAFASVLAILRAGATPVLGDIDPGTALLSLDSARRCLSPQTKAVLLVHLYGQLRDLPEWKSFCEERGIALVEDCAQSHLAKLGGRVAGTFSPVAAYSFYPTKNLGAPGDAGALITSSSAIAERAARIRNYGQSVRYLHPELGMNSRLDELQAAILTERLKWLGEFTDRRQHIAERYFREIDTGAVQHLARPQEKTAHVFHLFVVRCGRRAGLQEHLDRYGVQSLIHYPVPVHKQEPCRDIKRDPAGLGASEHHADTCLSIPCHSQMSDADVDTVIAAVNSF
jgi:dTDP-4-amino-4,6-dideoxygalactose transaminase